MQPRTCSCGQSAGQPGYRPRAAQPRPPQQDGVAFALGLSAARGDRRGRHPRAAAAAAGPRGAAAAWRGGADQSRSRRPSSLLASQRSIFSPVGLA
eukprot:14659616-Alexandrium_andersonii.AAC.1